MTWEGKLECLFWTKGCCGIGVWRDLWSLYSGQSRRRIGFPGCFALTLCSPSTAGKRPHLPDTHTHIRMQSLIIESKTRLWPSRAEALKRKTSHAPSLHSFICTSLQLRRKEKEERSGHSEEVDHTTLITQMQTWGEKQHLREKKRAGVWGTVQKPACLGLSLAIWLWICENWHQKRLIRDSLHKHKLQRAHKSSGTHKITQKMRLSIESNEMKH